jgi:hypothetical protein
MKTIERDATRLIVSNTNEQEAGTESTQALISAERKLEKKK